MHEQVPPATRACLEVCKKLVHLSRCFAAQVKTLLQAHRCSQALCSFPATPGVALQEPAWRSQALPTAFAGLGSLARREKFWKAVPPKDKAAGALWTDDAAVREADADAPPVPLVALNHCALGVSDLDNMARSGPAPASCISVAAKPRAAAWLCGVCASATAPQQLLPLPWSGASPAAAEQSHRLFASCSAAEPYAQASCAPALGTYAAAPGAAPVRVPCP